nr:hypothetical protein Iba_chr07dCG2650 [Ipomoea batatas]
MLLVTDERISPERKQVELEPARSNGSQWNYPWKRSKGKRPEPTPQPYPDHMEANGTNRGREASIYSEMREPNHKEMRKVESRPDARRFDGQEHDPPVLTSPEKDVARADVGPDALLFDRCLSIPSNNLPEE